jgi:hypothetical protein
MGNSIHIGGNLSHQRVPYNHANYRYESILFNISYLSHFHIFLSVAHIKFINLISQFNFRIRRPIYNIVSTSWKNQIPMRAVSLNNRPILPQRVPTKEFYSINKIPEYSPEYRPELVVLPPTHRGGVDDDKGPIHTIPAPNLSPADKPYNANLALTNLDDITGLNYYNSITPAQSKYNILHILSWARSMSQDSVG